MSKYSTEVYTKEERAENLLDLVYKIQGLEGVRDYLTTSDPLLDLEILRMREQLTECWYEPTEGTL